MLSISEMWNQWEAMEVIAVIRKVEEKDIPLCVKVIQESFHTVADELGLTAQNAPGFTAFAVTKEKLEQQFHNERCSMYAFEDNRKIIGYYALLLQDHHECELNHLCVLPAFRHRGIGEKLLISAFDAAKGLQCVKMNIGIVKENEVLKKWYQKLGFVHIAARKYDFFPFTCGYMEARL